MSQFFLYGVFKAWGEAVRKDLDADDTHQTRNSFLKTCTLFVAGAAAGMVRQSLTVVSYLPYVLHTHVYTM
jgi:hypothetical protein